MRELVACLTRDDDLRSPAAHEAFARVVAQPGIILSIGGGPRRVYPSLKNLNILLGEGVDVTATAYRLPFRDSSVGGIHCEAVLEHLEFPDIAVAEMHRVLRTGALAFAATPFLQPYHGYPDHFQNFTLRGHVRLFERARFEILASGICVGPTFAVVDIAANYARDVLPTRVLSRSAERLVRLIGRLFRVADIAARKRGSASNVCSSSFLLARKPVE